MSSSSPAPPYLTALLSTGCPGAFHLRNSCLLSGVERKGFVFSHSHPPYILAFHMFFPPLTSKDFKILNSETIPFAYYMFFMLAHPFHNTIKYRLSRNKKRRTPRNRRKYLKRGEDNIFKQLFRLITKKENPVGKSIN
jgi:hypothetical protein